MKNEIDQYEELYLSMDEKIAADQERYDKALAERYSDELRDKVHSLQERVSKYSVLGTYQMIFEATVKPFKEKNNIKTISGKYHRYDLYAQLMYAMKYYGKSVGQIKFMCVDEAQDLALNEYRLIRDLNSRNMVFNLFGDTKQLIKPGRGISDWDSMQRLFPADHFILNENYRNTNQITRFCNDSFGLNMLQTGVDGAKVREITRDEFADELTDLHITTERVAILLPRSVQKMKYIERIGSSDRIQGDIEEGDGQGKIAAMYVDEVKGIEFDKVYVVPNNMGQNEKYIAYTRALSELVLVIDYPTS